MWIWTLQTTASRGNILRVKPQFLETKALTFFAFGRNMVEPFFTRQHVDSLRPYIQKTVDELLDAMIAKGCEKPVELVENFALPVPSYVSFLTT